MSGARRPVLLDDRLLVEQLTVGLPTRPRPSLLTTSCWYFRAARAASIGAGGYLSGPFAGLPPALEQRAIASLLSLPDEIGLPDPRRVVPVMVEVAHRHPKLNLLNLEAAAAARCLGADVWLSPKGAEGILPSVLADLGLRSEVIELSE